jgi:hypothetical protein
MVFSITAVSWIDLFNKICSADILVSKTKVFVFGEDQDSSRMWQRTVMSCDLLVSGRYRQQRLNDKVTSREE